MGKGHASEKNTTEVYWEVLLTVVGIAVSLFATFATFTEILPSVISHVGDSNWLSVFGDILFSIIIFFLVYGGLVYLLARIGYLYRTYKFSEPTEIELQQLFSQKRPVLDILVPSYKEDVLVVRQTLLSALLQCYSDLRVVLLIDDPHKPQYQTDRQALVDMLELCKELAEEVSAIHLKTRDHLEQLSDAKRLGLTPETFAEQALKISAHFSTVARWLNTQISDFSAEDHAAQQFIQVVILPHLDFCESAAQEIAGKLRVTAYEDVQRYLQRLETIFSGELTSFQRKRFANLSWEPNKAMNLNSYIGLFGASYKIEQSDSEELLLPAPTWAADLHVRQPDYVLTLDADSIISPNYAPHLIYLMERPGNKHMAVAQTPYSAFPGAPRRLERLAGATTDIQYIIHQGFTAFGATYWVGANALIRVAALNDIAIEDQERGYTIRRFIQDRTVIEDTESSIDLVSRGWTLYNVPQRLAFSATPPDFGSLIIQRRRWANGGLIILPKLFKYLCHYPVRWKTFGEAFMRIHYLTSIAAVNFGLLLILAIPFTAGIETMWLPLTALPYFLLYARDLKRVGYRSSDIFGVYALNILLVPVNVGGVLKSVQQMFTKQKIPFGRTPKIAGRTAAQPLYIAAVYILILHWMLGAGFDWLAERYYHAAFAALNASFLLFALLALVGIRNSWEDFRLAFARRPSSGLRLRRRPQPALRALRLSFVRISRSGR